MSLTWGFYFHSLSRDSSTRHRLCWLVLIMVVRGFARSGIRVLGGLRRRRVRVCLCT